jgi:hypothetical protein
MAFFCQTMAFARQTVAFQRPKMAFCGPKMAKNGRATFLIFFNFPEKTASKPS